MGRLGEAKDLLGSIQWLLNNDIAGFVTRIIASINRLLFRKQEWEKRESFFYHVLL